ncbi:Hydroxypyruvate isomerase [Roseimaritima multifibrata]|uniref:Hydroxypyruvate isomerase n=1 Tax=Roseimaritima multifibrata TaxID=1930274 RepID=A0A517MN05_9BACT|nr:TIM barrel protein [Roseimaritima multifibrata]QDS96268.1 Hydroxypyruvate isomerase [Roseimaritima multifibrata]
MQRFHRRDWLRTGSLLAGGAVLANSARGDQPAEEKKAPQNSEPAIVNHRVRQSVMGWCFKPMGSVELAKHCKQIGIEAIEGIPASDYPAVTKLGLKISLTGSHGFAKGPLDPDNHAMVEAKLKEGIDLAVRYGAPNVITFTGMKKAGISEAAAKKNCVACWQRVIPYAEEKGIGIVLEHLNTRDDSHPMKGHPGYWGDDLEICADLIQAVGSDNFKLLFDLYHVQIMHGDLIRNLRRYQGITGHYHTAGNPGRCELDENQEINYPPVIRAIVETGYKGYLAQEFIPTWEDPMEALRHAAGVCDV